MAAETVGMEGEGTTVRRGGAWCGAARTESWRGWADCTGAGPVREWAGPGLERVGQPRWAGVRRWSGLEGMGPSPEAGQGRARRGLPGRGRSLVW